MLRNCLSSADVCAAALCGIPAEATSSAAQPSVIIVFVIFCFIVMGGLLFAHAQKIIARDLFV